MNAENVFAFTAVGTDTHERLYFVAAALTIGFELADNTPKCSNVFSVDKKYDPGEPGDVRYYIDVNKGELNINEFVKVWKNREPALREAEAFPGLILLSDDGQNLVKVVQEFDRTYLRAAVATMRQFSLRRISVPDLYNELTEEAKALQTLDTFVTRLETMRTKAEREKAAQLLCTHWRPAMSGWVKAWHKNYLELRNLWKTAPEAIKIERRGLPPLVIPKGPKFKEMLERWT